MKASKFILALITAILFNIIVGDVFAASVGLNPTAVVSVMMGITCITLFVKPVRGVLSDVVIGSAYAGEVLEQLLVKATMGNELVAGGHIRVQPNITHKFFIPRIKTGTMLQKRKEQPVEADSKGEFDISEKVLEPKDLMAFTTFNPRVFEHIWRIWQPTGNLVFSLLPTDIQNQLLAELAKVIDFELGYHFIQGKEGAGETDFFNGILTRIAADADVLKIATPAIITEANIIATLKSIRATIPKVVRRNPNLKIFMSQEDFDMYENSLTALPYKGQNYTDVNPERFKGIPIVVITEWPKDAIVAAVANTGLDSNFWAAVNYVNDSTVIEIEKLTNSGEKYFFKMLMKADTNIVFGEQIVLYDAR